MHWRKKSSEIQKLGLRLRDVVRKIANLQPTVAPGSWHLCNNLNANSEQSGVFCSFIFKLFFGFYPHFTISACQSDKFHDKALLI